MPTPLAEMLRRNFPSMLRHAGEDAVYISADGTETSFFCVVNGRAEASSLEQSWEVSARQVEVFAEAEDVPEDYTAREDIIEVRGAEYTVMERATTQGSQYRFLCEREDVDAVSLRGRRY